MAETTVCGISLHTVAIDKLPKEPGTVTNTPQPRYHVPLLVVLFPVGVVACRVVVVPDAVVVDVATRQEPHAGGTAHWYGTVARLGQVQTWITYQAQRRRHIPHRVWRLIIGEDEQNIGPPRLCCGATRQKWECR
jgi:hypothetical protein